MTVIQEQLDRVSLSVLPSPLRLARALRRPAEPFVMINLISFKAQATGKYAHLTGQQAYELYARSVEEAQAPLGSRLLWLGKVLKKLTEGKAPALAAIALLEYASPKAFLQFATRGGSNVQARRAGLLGQWLIAATTLEENTEHSRDESHSILVEYAGGIHRHTETCKSWGARKQVSYAKWKAITLWHGCCDQHVLGRAVPAFDETLVTWFPDDDSLKNGILTFHEDAARHADRPILAYTTASLLGFLPGLSV